MATERPYEFGEPVRGKARCDSCGTLWDEDELEPIDDLHQRVAPGEIMPAGQCPDEDCGAVCHLIWEGQ
jgi:hypothetical protein